jgi:hypothetical protein
VGRFKEGNARDGCAEPWVIYHNKKKQTDAVRFLIQAADNNLKEVEIGIVNISEV